MIATGPLTVSATVPAVVGGDGRVLGAQPAASTSPLPWKSALSAPRRAGDLEPARAEQAEREIVGVDAGGAQGAAALDAEFDVEPARALDVEPRRADQPGRAQARGGERDA